MICFKTFFLVTSLDWKDWTPHKILQLYRKRGKAEGHMGELKDTLNVHLSSTCRGASTVQQVMGRNQVSLLLSSLRLSDAAQSASADGARHTKGLEHTQSPRADPENSSDRGRACAKNSSSYRTVWRQMVAQSA
jgi:hypothetical protein